MIPKPPFACDLTLDDEVRAFERLKPRLRGLWTAVFPGDEAAYTSVVVPSLVPAPGGRQGLPGAPYHEERLLFLMIRLRNPQARLIYVTSVPIHPLVVEYYLQLLVGIPASHARSRLTLLSAHDHSPRPLAQKVLERPRLLERIRVAIPDRERAYLTVFKSTPLDRRLAVLLDIPMNGLDPALSHLGTKSGSRRIFREAGVEAAIGGAVGPAQGASEVTSPSVQLRVNAHGVPHISSTHEQAPGGSPDRPFLRYQFPARSDYRARLHEAGLRIGKVLARKGVVSRLTVDFLAARAGPESAWDLKALDIDLGMGGTTHPMLALRFLTGGALDPGTGLFCAPSGHAKYYTATDGLQSAAYVGLLPEDLIDILTIHKLAFNQGSETGVLFHTIGGISQFGRVGLIAIGNSGAEAEDLHARTVEILDDETRYGRPSPGH